MPYLDIKLVKCIFSFINLGFILIGFIQTDLNS